jgi:hypothetical protein
METSSPNAVNSNQQPLTPVSNDVLHIPSTSKLTSDEIAKAVAHHNKHHHDKPGNVSQNTTAGKKIK